MNSKIFHGFFKAPFISIFTLSLLSSCGGGDVNDKTSIQPEPITTNNPEPEAKEELVTKLSFRKRTIELGLSHQWDLIDLPELTGLDYSLYNSIGGIALGDYDQDGDIDIYLTAGNKSASKLFQKQADGSYIDVAIDAGVQLQGFYSGPSFADIDNDGDLDLFVGGIGVGIGGTRSKLFINDGNGHFVEGQAPTISKEYTVSSSFSDFNNDGFIDLAISHYASSLGGDSEHLWVNIDGVNFESISSRNGLAQSILNNTDNVFSLDLTFTPSFGDINNNGVIDLLMLSDFGTTSLLLSTGDTSFIDFNEHTDKLNLKTDDVHGMGGTLADIDNDGDLDIFITSILEVNAKSGILHYSGNKLLINNNDGTFVDQSYTSGILNGGWGWASCIVDFDNDGLLDIINTNGWNIESGVTLEYESHVNDTTSLFKNMGDNKFIRLTDTVGITDTGQGRSMVCFDHDNDGDIDILISNNDVGDNSLIFYENVSTSGNFLKIDLRIKGKNTYALGARVYLTVINDKGEYTQQMREVNINSNFTSQTPSQLHFGVNRADNIAEVKIVWPNGDIELLTDVAVNQSLIIEK
ncbi:MAG: CRTAC1 family protein [Colwellia sp.]|nr:CRTAC1 family protein [Colwellia sp.]